MGRLWQFIGDKTELNQADANISAIACEIFGKSRGHMAEEALKVIQRHLWDECTMEEANHAIGLCTALPGAPVIDDEVKAWISAVQRKATYSGALYRTFDEPEPVPNLYRSLASKWHSF